MGRVYQDYLSDLKDFVEPAPTGFILIIGLEINTIWNDRVLTEKQRINWLSEDFQVNIDQNNRITLALTIG